MAWADLIANTITIDLATFGQPVTYSRPDSPNFDGIAPFTITAVVVTSGEYMSPTAQQTGAISVRLSDIPLGPQKGDLVVPSQTAFSVVAGRTYRVQELLLDTTEGHGNLEIRWTGQ